MRLIAYPDRDQLYHGLAKLLAEGLDAAIAERGHASLSVPGGTTPGPVFDILSKMPLDWAKVAVFLNDERWVGEDSPRSNTGLLRARLLCGPAAKAKLVPLYAPAAQPEDQLTALAEGLTPEQLLNHVLTKDELFRGNYQELFQTLADLNSASHNQDIKC